MNTSTKIVRTTRTKARFNSETKQARHLSNKAFKMERKQARQAKSLSYSLSVGV